MPIGLLFHYHVQLTNNSDLYPTTLYTTYSPHKPRDYIQIYMGGLIVGVKSMYIYTFLFLFGVAGKGLT